MYYVDIKTKLCSEGQANLLFELVLDSSVALEQGGWQGLQHDLAEQPSRSKVQFLLHWKACPWHRAGGQASWDRAEPNPHTALSAGSREGRSMKICRLSALGNLLKIAFGKSRAFGGFHFCF